MQRVDMLPHRLEEGVISAMEVSVEEGGPLPQRAGYLVDERLDLPCHRLIPTLEIR